LHEYYAPSREVACYRSFDDLVRQVRHYLEHEDERAAVADAGYARTLAEHTYAHRFAEIFRTIGAPEHAGDQSLHLDAARAGRVEMAA
jgi:spore maturation protein CgeB